jgi:hypothetical protein
MRRPAKASDVLDQHRKLRASLSHPVVAEYIDAFMQDKVSKASGGDMQALLADKDYDSQRWRDVGFRLGQMFHPANTPDQFRALIGKDLFEARTYQVTEEMVDAVSGTYQATRANMNSYSESDLPYPAGFAWLDKPAVIGDVRGNRTTIRAVSWALATITIADNTEGENLRVVPGVRVVSWGGVSDLDHYWRAEHRDQWLAQTHGEIPLMYTHSNIVPFGQRMAGSESVTTDDFAIWAQVLMMFMGSEIVSTTKPALRPFSMKKFTTSMKEPPEVNVIRLRRMTDRPVDDHEVQHVHIDWSCRWLVQGFHRHNSSYEVARHHAVPDSGQGNKVCAVCGGSITWVRPHIKGPPDKPLRALDQLYRLQR